MNGWTLILITVLLVLVGCVMYVIGWVGWAQLWWVLASGTAGGGVAMILGASMNGWLAVFAFTAAALVAFTAWLLHRARRMVDRDRYRTGGPP